jgi:hypothetical protein
MKVQDEEYLDPRLKQALELLRPVPRRDTFAAARAKANFLVELEGLYEPDLPSGVGFLANPTRWLRALKKPQFSFFPFPRTALSLSAILLIVVFLIFGWAGITARAAEMAVPGDTLYSFKTGIEQVQVALAGDLDKQAGLYLEFASHRLLEIEQLVETGRYQKAIALSPQFRSNIQKALDITNRLDKVNPARAAQRRIEIAAKVASFTAQLDALLVKIPSSYQPAFNNVIHPALHDTPVSPVLTQTQTPELTAEATTPSGVDTDQQEKLQDGSGTDLDKGNQGESENENHSGASGTEDAGTTNQEGSGEDAGLDNDPISTEEGSGENANPSTGGHVNQDGTHNEHDSEDHADKPFETQIPDPAPPPEHN